MGFLETYWLQLITLIVNCGLLKFAYSVYTEYKQRTEARDEALKCLLRTDIYAIYHRGEERGHIPLYSLENVTDMYKSYHALGGNGAVTTIYQKILAMPHDAQK